MKTFGALLFAFGIVIGWFGLVMETTIETGEQTIGGGTYSVTVPKTTVHNIGLMHKREMTFYGAGLSLLLGTIFIGFGTLAANGSQEKTVTSQQLLSQLQKLKSGALISPEEVESLVALAKQQPLDVVEANSSNGNLPPHFASPYFYSLKVGVLMYFKPYKNKENQAKVGERNA